jgi:hypothetical protein
MSHMLTGHEWVVDPKFAQPGGIPVGFAGGPSLDQHLAKTLNVDTRFTSLAFGVQSVSDYGVHPFSRMLSAGPNQPVPPEDSPEAMFTRIFTDGGAEAGAQIEQVLAQRRSVLDFVNQDFVALQSQLSGTDKARLDAHAETLRVLEKRLAAPGATGCVADPTLLTGEDPDDKSKFPEIGKQQMDILSLALRCDVSRVTSIQWSWARSLLSFPWIDVNEGHHNITHQDPTPELSRVNRWYAEQLVYLAQSLDAIDDVDGKSVLDNTIIWWCGETARGYDHDFHNIRVFLVGGGGVLKTGEHIRMNDEPHNKLLVHLMNSMGVDGDTFGGPEFGSGALTGINLGT